MNLSGGWCEAAGGSEEVEIKQGLSEGDEVIVSDMREYLDATEIRLR